MERPSLRVGVAGVGRMGLRHVDAVLRRDDVNLCAVADPSVEALSRARELARRDGTREPMTEFADAREMLGAGKLDCVIIATPPHVHSMHCVAALQRGIAVLVEKPLAVSLEDGQAVVDEAGRSGVLLSVGHVERFNPVVEALRDHVRRGLVGQLLAIETWRHGPAPGHPRAEGVALDLAVHDVDLLRYVFDDYPVEVATRPHANLPIEERLDAEMNLASGIRALLSVGRDAAVRERGIAVVGERGAIEVDLVSQELRYTFDDPDLESAGWQSQAFAGEPLMREHDAWFEAIWNGWAPPISGNDALRALYVVHALLASAAQGRPVSVLSPVAA